MNRWLTDGEILEIVELYFKQKWTQDALGRKYKVSQSAISLILNRKRHKVIKCITAKS